VLIAQCTYYNTRNARRARRRERTRSTATEDSEDEPLLSRRRSSSLGLPGSHRRHSIRQSDSNIDALTRIITGEDDTPDASPWLHNTLSLLAVWLVGAAGYFVSYRIGAWDVAPDLPDPAVQETTELIGMVLGYFSAACYLFARVPQIIKNYREKSCQGMRGRLLLQKLS
jgi:solute carrier family 66 (lysosomal lysine-arginine transporter), member 1